MSKKVERNYLEINSIEELNEPNNLAPDFAIEIVQPDLDRLQQDISERIGADVKIQHSASGRGKLILRYNSLDELDGILAHIK